MEAPSDYQHWYLRILDAQATASDVRFGAQAVLALVDEISAAVLTPQIRAALLFVCSSLVTNAGDDLHDTHLLKEGAALAQSSLDLTDRNTPLHFQCLYNLANAVAIECDLGLPAGESREEWEPQLIENRITCREQLRWARCTFFQVGMSEIADPHTRSAALCNLANSLDHSGRWAEAYDFYLSALDADPNNGNAAGNLAHLLMHRLQLGIGQTGHIAAVYDKYVKLAQSLHDGTVEFAGQDIAGRWDGLELTESEGHLSHGIEGQDDDYRQWVAAYRLALSPAVEGLGTESPHWDSSIIEMLFGSSIDEVSPPILAEMNVLKSDFLVSRRLAYEGYGQVADGPEQKDDDSGYYVETLDYSLYGTQYSKLFLAQRSALDVLDKTAVVANEHFHLGDRPGGVSFRQFWSDNNGAIRSGLISKPGRGLAALALSELAFDMTKEGMYASSQALRNAGTHRIVHAAFLETTGATADTRSRIHFIELVDSTIQALQVTRSAYLYLVDLVASWNMPEDHPGEHATIETYEYMNFPVSESSETEEPAESSRDDS